MISQQRPAGLSPAILARSTVASVCPGRARTPHGFALRGNICPGRLKSAGLAPSLTASIAVMERAAAEIPVPASLKSIDVRNAVWLLSVL